MMGFRRSSVPLASFGVYDPAPDLDSAPDPLPDVEAMLAACSPLGRQVLELVTLEGLSVKQAAHQLHMSQAICQAAHDGACLTVAREFRRLGWTEESYRMLVMGG